jgi:hemerythrin-like metal-binding protein
MWDGKGKEVLDKNLLFLADYTIEHFGTEETLMKQHNYPHYMAHKKLHDDFVQEVKEFIAKFESEDLGTDLVVAVGTKLGDWVREHVKRTDVQFGKFLASKRIKS